MLYVQISLLEKRRGAHLTTGQHFSSGSTTKNLQTSKSKFNELNALIWCTWPCLQRKTKQSSCFPREVDVVLRYLKEQCGAKHIGVVGFCWGGVATHYIALQYQEIKAGVSVYGNVLLHLYEHAVCNPSNCIYINLTQVSLESGKTGLTSRVQPSSYLLKMMQSYLLIR